MKRDYRWILQLIDRCYEAIVDDDRWPELLKDLGDFLGGESTTLFFTDAQLRPVDRFFGDNVSPESIASYRAHFHKLDIRMQRMVPGALNSIVTDGDLVDQAVIDRHAFYQDFLRPIGHRYILAAAMDLGDGCYAFCSSHRGLQQDHADSESLERADLVMPHVRRCLQVRRRIAMDGAHGQAAFELLDGLGQAVFLLDGAGRIVWQNAWASRLLRQHDGWLSVDAELRAHAAPANNVLQRLIKAAITKSKRPKARPGGMMTVPRPSLKRPYQVLVTPLSKNLGRDLLFLQFDICPAAAVFVMDLEQKSVPRVEVLRTLYNLTPSEARLAMALGSGVSLKAYAENARLSIHYVRWLLKQVEAKTDTRRITDLIRLLARQTGLFGTLIENEEGKDE